VIVISDERASQPGEPGRRRYGVTDKGVKRTYGFASNLHDPCPMRPMWASRHARSTATLGMLFGEWWTAYPMTES